MPAESSPDDSWDAPLRRSEQPHLVDKTGTEQARHTEEWNEPLTVNNGPRLDTMPETRAELTAERTATSATNPDIHLKFTVHSGQEIGMGVETKTLLSARDEDGNEFSFFERSSHEKPEERRESNHHYITTWLVCRVAGIPVVPEVFISDNDTLLVTDVKADGSEAYGKGMAQALTGYLHERHRPHTNIDRLFIEATAPSNIDTIKAEAERYSQLATRAQMELPDDDPFELIIHPNGTWELMILDLDRAMHVDSDHLDGILGDRMVRKNREAVDFFMFQLSKIRGKLLTG